MHGFGSGWRRRAVVVGLVLGTAGGLGGGVPVASAAVGQFDYARVRRLEPRTGQLTVAYGMSGLRDAHVAVAPAMRATASYRCRAPRQRPAVSDVTVTAAIFRPEDQRDTVRQPDGTRAVEGELTVDPPPPPAGFCAGGQVRLRAVSYDDPQLVATLVDDVSGLGSRKIIGRLGFRVQLLTDDRAD